MAEGTRRDEQETEKVKQYINGLVQKVRNEFWGPLRESEGSKSRFNLTRNSHKKSKERTKSKNRIKFCQEILNQLQNTCKSKIMDELMERFIEETLYKSTFYDFLTEVTEIRYQVFCHLKRYILLSLAYKAHLTICDSIALEILCTILSDVLLEVLFEVQKLKTTVVQNNMNAEENSLDSINECVKACAVRGDNEGINRKISGGSRFPSSVELNA